MSQEFYILVSFLIVAPQVAALSDDVVEHVDFVDKRQKPLAFGLVLQILLDLVGVKILDSLEGELVNLVIFHNCAQTKSV